MQFARKSAREQEAGPARPEAASGPQRGATAGIPLFARGEMRVTTPDDAVEREAAGTGASVASTDATSGPPVNASVRDSIAGAMRDGAARSANGAPLHTGSKAAELARSLNAEAFTVNGNIFLGASSQAGPSAALLEHELVHAAQQSKGGGAWIGRQTSPALPPDLPLDVRAPALLKDPLTWPLIVAARSSDDQGLGNLLGEAAVAALADEIDSQQAAGLRARAAEVGKLRSSFGGQSIGLAGALKRLNDLFSADPAAPTNGDPAYAPLYMIRGVAGDIAYHVSTGLDTTAVVPATPASGPSRAAQPASLWLINLQNDLENTLKLLSDGDRLLELELEATVGKLVELRGEFQNAATQDERAVYGSQIGTTARKALLLNQKLQEVKEERKQGKTPLDQKVESRLAEIGALRAKGEKESDALRDLGDTPERLAQADIPIENPFFESPFSQGTQVEPEEAFPEALDSATRKMQNELAGRIRAQAAAAKQQHDQLVPQSPAYTLPEFMGVHAHWFALFSQEQERMKPLYRFFAETMLGQSYKLMGHPALDKFGQVEGAIARVWMMGWAAAALEDLMGSTSPDFAGQMETFAPQRQQQPLSGYAASPTYRYGQIYPGATGSPDVSAEQSSRIVLPGMRQTETSTLRTPEFEKLDFISKHFEAMKAKAVSPRAGPLPIVTNQTPAEGWSYLITVADPMAGPVLREHKVMPLEMAQYLLTEQQQYATLAKPHVPETESGKAAGDKRMRTQGVEGAQSDAAARYLRGVANPDTTPESMDLGAAVAEAKAAGVPSGRSPAEAAANSIAHLTAEFEAYFEEFFVKREDGSFRVAAVLAIASAEFGLGRQLGQLIDPGTIALLMGQGFAIGFATSTLDALGPLGKMVSSGLNAYLARGATNPIAAAAGVVAFVKGASGVGSFRAARAWAVVAAAAAADDFANLYSMVVMSGPQAAGGAAARGLIESISRNPPSTPRALLDTCRPLLEAPESRARIVEGTRARIAELENQGAKPGQGNDEYDALIEFEKMLRPYDSSTPVAKPAKSSSDPFADAPLKGAQSETEATKFFEAGRFRTADQRMALFNAIPAELQSAVMLVESPNLPGHTVRVRYDNGELRLEVGPRAEPGHIQAHLGVARELRRYQGVMGAIRRLASRIGTLLRITPGYGTQGFESKLEVAKLRGIEAALQTQLAAVEARSQRLNDTPDLAANQAEKEAIQKEIGSIQDQLAEHEALVNSYDPARGFVAAYAPTTAKGTLDQFLTDVWTRGTGEAYRLYQRRTSAEAMDPAARRAYAKALLAIARDPNVATVAVQKQGMTSYAKTKLPTAQEVGKAGFLHYRRGDFGKVPVTERIYLNVVPDHAAAVMEFVVNTLMTPEVTGVEPIVPGMARISRRGITIAKVASSTGLETRADTVVIGAATQADVEWALNRLEEYQAAHPDHFLAEVPAATHPEFGLKGVATAAEPPAALGTESFGTYLENVVTAVMQKQPPPANEAEFKAQVRARMAADGIDPDHPNRLTRIE